MLDVQREMYAEPHQAVGTNANNLAGLMRDMGRLAEAEALYGEALRSYRAVLGPDHYWCSIVCVNLAKVHAETGRWETCISMLEEADRIRALHPDPSPWSLAEVDAVRATAIAAQGRHQDAEDVLIRAIEILEAERGGTDSKTRDAIRRLVDVYEQWGRRDAAASWRLRLPGDV